MKLSFFNDLSISNKAIFVAFYLGFDVLPNGCLVKNENKFSGYKNGQYSCFTVRFPNCMTRRRMSSKVRVHRLQAYKKFGDKIFEQGIEVRHLNGNSFDNCWKNIGIGTPKENASDKTKETNMRCALAGQKGQRIKNKDRWIPISKDRKLGMTYKQLSEKYNVSKSTLSYHFGSDCKLSVSKDYKEMYVD